MFVHVEPDEFEVPVELVGPVELDVTPVLLELELLVMVIPVFVASDQPLLTLELVPVVPVDEKVESVVPVLDNVLAVVPVPPVEFVVELAVEKVELKVELVVPVEPVVQVEPVELEDDELFVVPVEFEFCDVLEVKLEPEGPFVEPVVLVELVLDEVSVTVVMFVASDHAVEDSAVNPQAPEDSSEFCVVAVAAVSVGAP